MPLPFLMHRPVVGDVLAVVGVEAGVVVERDGICGANRVHRGCKR